MRRRARATAAVTVSALLVAVLPAGALVAVDEEPAPASLLAAQAAVRPRVVPSAPAPLTPAVRGLLPLPAAVAAAVEDELARKWLGPSVSLTVRDVTTGQHLLDVDPDRQVTPASLTKLLSAAAVAAALPLEERFTTRVVAGEQAGDVVLVAGGDMLLAAGEGAPESVAGRAGLADLATQVASAVREGDAEPGPVRLVLDLSYAEGGLRAPGWSDYWVAQGYAGGISMLGLDRDRAFPLLPGPADPAQSAAQAFAEALLEAGVDVAAGADSPVERQDAAPDARVLGEVESATAGDVLALALAESDNALVEQLTRQAAVRAGVTTEPEAVYPWVVEQVAGYGIDVTGVELADASGLSGGTQVPVRVVADVLVAAGAGGFPGLQAALAELPIAGYTGTLWDRFHLEVHDPAVGVVRAKTGSLPGVTALAGVLVTRDDRQLAFAVVADRIGMDGAALEARSVLDEVVTELVRCGC